MLSSSTASLLLPTSRLEQATMFNRKTGPKRSANVLNHFGVKMMDEKIRASVFLKLTGVIIFMQVIAFAQGQERIIDKMSWRTEPIKILKLKTKGKAIELGKKFSEEDDWLKGLTVIVENISTKAIARIELDLTFPRQDGSTSPETAIYIVPMIYGQDPADVPASEVLKLILPGETVEVRLLEVNLPLIKEDLKKLGYPARTTHTQVRVNSVTFVDGSEWAGDEMFYPDPKNPRQKINPKYPTDRQVPDASRSPPERSAFPVKSSEFRFLNVGFRSTQPSTVLSSSEMLLRNFSPAQDPTLPCDTVFLGNSSVVCGRRLVLTIRS